MDTSNDSGPVCTGRIKFYREDRGFGFIKPDDVGSDPVFFHRDMIKGDVEPELADKVEFTSEHLPGRRGRAVRVAIIGTGYWLSREDE
jgi:CspA family cold shock protein